jgi:hypothetical protein
MFTKWVKFPFASRTNKYLRYVYTYRFPSGTAFMIVKGRRKFQTLRGNGSSNVRRAEGYIQTVYSDFTAKGRIGRLWVNNPSVTRLMFQALANDEWQWAANKR